MSNGLGLTLNIPPPTPHDRPTSSHSFILSASSGSSSPTDSDAPLPFPTALARRDFLVPDFHAAGYLSSLFPSGEESESGTGTGFEHRHQTLEDLRADLRERSAAISAELLELVNANYTSFLSLGDELKGGEERAEDVRVALLGFRRHVEDIKGRVRGRREDVDKTTRVLGGVRGDIELGRRMLELDERIGLLEGRLAVGSLPSRGKQDGQEEWEDTEESDDEYDGQGHDGAGEGFVGSGPTKLTALAKEYLAIEALADAVGRDLPYVKKMEERMTRCRNTLLLDLGNATKEARKSSSRGHDRVLRYLGIYRLLGAHAEGVRVLKES